jgi:hypothetical protein
LSRTGGAAEVGESLRKTAGGWTRLGPCDEGDFGIGDRREAILGAQHAMIGENRDLGQDADAEAGRDRCLDAEDTSASFPRIESYRAAHHLLARLTTAREAYDQFHGIGVLVR